MGVDRETISVVESVAYKVHEAERHYLRLRLNDSDREELDHFFEGIKSQIGRFFMKHVDRRSTLRPHATVEENYKSFWELGPKAGKTAHIREIPTITSCRFCGADDLKERTNEVVGEVYWYCNTCHQENRLPGPRGKGLPKQT